MLPSTPAPLLAASRPTAGWRRLALVLGAAGLAWTVAACDGKPGASFKILLARSGTDRCVMEGVQPPDVPLSPTTVSHVRLSVRTRGAGGEPSFLCDRIVQVPQDQPILRLGVTGAQAVDLFAEGFLKTEQGFQRVATGTLFNVALPIKAGELSALKLYNTGSFRCVDSRLTQARAFHSATLLPNGQVLVVGGLVAAADPKVEQIAPTGLLVTSTVEIYDPAKGAFATLTETTPGIPRAFHQAALLGSEPPYRVLLAGGVTSDDPTRPVLAKNLSSFEGSRLVPFDPVTFQPFPIKAAAAEILTYDPVKREVSRAPDASVPAAAFQAGAQVPDGLAVVGGLAYGAMNQLDLTPATTVTVRQGDAAQLGRLVSPRVGATLTRVFADIALLWGGAPADMAPNFPPPGDLILDLTSPIPSSKPVGPSGIRPTQFHSASAVEMGEGRASVLVTGGFEVMGRSALQPPAGATGVRLLEVTPGGVEISAMAPVLMSDWVIDPTCTMPGRYRPAGWQSSAALPNGKVLITGGAPTAAPTCNDCEPQSVNQLCSIRQAALFEAPNVMRKLDDLQVGRFGHTSTVLPDGNVLLAGGISLPPGMEDARTVADAEIFNPRTRQPAADQDRDDPLFADLAQRALTRAPGDVVRGADGKPAAACPDL